MMNSYQTIIGKRFLITGLCQNSFISHYFNIYLPFNIISLSRPFSNAEGKKDGYLGSSPSIPRNSQEEHQKLTRKAVPNPQMKLLKIAIIGTPNVGKSTLINQLVNWKVCSVSSKVHTTLSNARAIFTHNNTQLVFVDTPGMVSHTKIRRHNLKGEAVSGPESSLHMADLIAVVHDVENKFERKSLPHLALRLLLLYPQIPSILILNKVDKIKNKSDLFDLIKILTMDKVSGIKTPSNIEVKTKSPNLIIKEYMSKEEKIFSDSPENLEAVSHAGFSPDIDKSPSGYNSQKDYVANSEHSEPRESIDFMDDSLCQNNNLFRSEDDDPLKNISDEDVYEGKIRLSEFQIPHFIKSKQGWPKFDDVFLTSALKGIGVDDLRGYLLASAVPSPWWFTDDVVTDQSPQALTLQILRSACLEIVSPHNPRLAYSLEFDISHWDLTQADVLDVLINVYVYKQTHLKLLLMKKGRMVSLIAKETETKLRSTFRSEICLRLNVALAKTKK